MILIADSGSTKTVWALATDGVVTHKVRTQGLNPYFLSPERIHMILSTELVPGLPDEPVTEVFFYGAGCSTESNNKVITDQIRANLPGTRVSVFHDILGAARALFGTGHGIACILGTGCNSCYFDGKDIHSRVPSLGYLFGDEGAGSYLGKLFFTDYFRGTLPADIRSAFDEQYRYRLEDILNALYNQPFPNRFLASVSLFLHPRKDHPYVRTLVAGSFRDFYRTHIVKYDGFREEPLGFIGSIAYQYSDILEEVLNEEGMTLHRILTSPLEGLIGYHLPGASLQ